MSTCTRVTAYSQSDIHNEAKDLVRVGGILGYDRVQRVCIERHKSNTDMYSAQHTMQRQRRKAHSRHSEELETEYRADQWHGTGSECFTSDIGIRTYTRVFQYYTREDLRAIRGTSGQGGARGRGWNARVAGDIAVANDEDRPSNPSGGCESKRLREHADAKQNGDSVEQLTTCTVRPQRFDPEDA